jgi:hypothetical protein
MTRCGQLALGLLLLISTSAIAQENFVRVINGWQPELLLTGNGAAVSSSRTPPDAAGAHWTIEPVGGDSVHVRLRNRASGRYLHNEHGALEVGAIQTDWWSAMWLLEETGEARLLRIRNRWTQKFLDATSGTLALTDGNVGWGSETWRFEPVVLAAPTSASDDAPPTGFSADFLKTMGMHLPVSDSSGGQASTGHAGVNLEAQLLQLPRVSPSQRKTASTFVNWEGYLNFADPANPLDKSRMGRPEFGHIQAIGLFGDRGMVALETATDGKEQHGFLLGIFDFQPAGAKVYAVPTTINGEATGYASNVDVDGDYLVVSRIGERGWVFRRKGGQLERLPHYDTPRNCSVTMCTIAFHHGQQRMFLFDGEDFYRSAKTDLLDRSCAPRCWRSLVTEGLDKVNWGTAPGISVAEEGASLIYDGTSKDLYLIVFGKSHKGWLDLAGRRDDEKGTFGGPPVAELLGYQRFEVGNDRVRMTQSGSVPLRYPTPTFAPGEWFPMTSASFRWGGGATVTSEGRLRIAATYRSMRPPIDLSPGVPNTLTTIAYWQSNEAVPASLPARGVTSRDFIGNLMCAVDDAARSQKNWVRLGARGGYWPLISTRHQVWRTGFLLARDIPNQPRSWDIRFAPASGKPTNQLGFTAYEEDNSGSWAVAQTTDNGRYVYTAMDSIELIPVGDDGWFRIQGKARGRGVRHLSCRHYGAASEPREQLSLQWRSSTSRGDSTNPIGQLFRLCSTTDLERCNPLEVPRQAR